MDYSFNFDLLFAVVGTVVVIIIIIINALQMK